MSVTDEEFKELRDAVRDLASHVAAALDELEAGIEVAAKGNASTDVLATMQATVKRTNSHIADVRVRLQGHTYDQSSLHGLTDTGRCEHRRARQVAFRAGYQPAAGTRGTTVDPGHWEGSVRHGSC